MKLDSIEYTEYEGEARQWRLKDFTLGDINLIVGINASGKTRTINVANSLGNLMSRSVKPLFNSLDYTAKFGKENKIITYQLSIRKRQVAMEKLHINGDMCLLRENNREGELHTSEVGKNLKFQIEENEIAVFAKRDSIQHPFLNDLYNWGKNLRVYRFGERMGREVLSARVDLSERNELDLKDSEAVVDVLNLALQISGDTFKKSVIEDMKLMGYDLDEIGIYNPSNIILQQAVHQPLIGIFVREADLQDRIEQINISQGMFRALSLLIQLNYSQISNIPSCILIDDIGEGLDYDRATALIKLVIEKARNSNVQLIMTTNDRFVMNNVPLEYWSIIERSGSECRIINYLNSKKIFDEFAFTGLNNFDFFSSGYFAGRPVSS